MDGLIVGVLLLGALTGGCRPGGADGPPRIDSVSPASGPSDRDVTIAIAGAALAPDGAPPRVLLDERALDRVRLDGDRVLAVVPAGLLPGARDVRVFTRRFLVARQPRGYTVLPPPQPRPLVSFLSPVDGTSVRPGASVRVALLARSPVARIAQVVFDTDGASVHHAVTDVQPPVVGVAGNYTLDVPNGAAPGDTIRLVAYALDDQQPPLRGDAATVTLHISLAPPPTVARIDPVRGPDTGGNPVDVFGSGFTPDSIATLDGVALARQMVVAPDHIAGVAPAHAAGAVDVRVTNVDGSGLLVGGYYYKHPPVVSSVAPGFGTTAGGTVVTLRGAGFDAGLRVTFDGAPAAALAVVDATTAVATTPAGSMGLADVTVSEDTAADTLMGGFRYVAPAAVGSIAPGHGSALGATAVTVVGDGFIDAGGLTTRVTLGGRPLANVAVLDRNHLTGFTPPGAGIVDVAVQNPIGAATLPRGFGYDPPPPAALRFVSLAPGSLPADGTSTSQAMVAADDAAGAPVAGLALAVTASDGAVASVPVDHQDGTYGFTVTAPPQVPPTGQVHVAVAWRVLAADAFLAITPPPRLLSIEDAPGGTGMPIGALVLTAGDTLPLFAVVRDGQGRFVADAPAQWLPTPLGKLAPGPATSATFTATTVGSGALGAAWNGGTATTGMLQVVAGPLVAFTVAVAASVTAATPVPAAIASVDAWGNLVTGFNGGLGFADLSAGVDHPPSPTFGGGRATATVTFASPFPRNQLFVADAANHSGKSNVFDVVPLPPTTVTVANLGSVDTTLRSQPGATGWNFGGEPTLGVGAVDARSAGDKDRALIRFDVKSALPAGATLIAAKLNLYGTPKGWARLRPISIANSTGRVVPDGTPASLRFDHQTLVANGLSAADGSDVHLIWSDPQNGFTEIEREPDATFGWNDAATTVWFKTTVPIPANSVDGASYWLGYGVVAAPPVTPDLNSVFAPPPTAQTVGLFHCEDGQGARLTDSSGHGNHGVLVGFQNPPWGSGYLSGGVGFDGRGYVVAPIAAPAGAFTVETWFRTGDSNAGLLSFQSAPPNRGVSDFDLYLCQAGLLCTDYIGLLGVRGRLSGGLGYDDDAWHHAALVYDGFALHLYADGVQVASALNLGLLGTPALGNFVLGAGGGQPMLVGRLDGIRVQTAAATSFPYATVKERAMAGAEQFRNAPHPIAAYRVLQSWIPGTGTPAALPPTVAPASWIGRNATNAWSAPGASAWSDTAADNGAFDAAATPLAAVVVGDPQSWYALDVTTAVSHWLDGSWAENGLLLAGVPEDNDFDRISFASANEPNASLHPSLSLTYYAGGGTPLTIDIPATSATTIDDSQPDTNFGGAGALEVYDTGMAAARALLHFNLAGNVPAGKSIVRADLLLFHTGNGGSAPSVVSARSLLHPFTGLGATWNSAGPSPWQVPGAAGPGDRAARAESAYIVAGQNVVDRFDLFDFGQGWLDQPQSDFGVVLQLDAVTANAGPMWAMPSSAQPPTLRVSYLP